MSTLWPHFVKSFLPTLLLDSYRKQVPNQVEFIAMNYEYVCSFGYKRHLYAVAFYNRTPPPSHRIYPKRSASNLILSR